MKLINLDQFEFVEGGKEKLVAEFNKVFETSDIAWADFGDGKLLLLVSPKLIQQAILDAVGVRLMSPEGDKTPEGDKDAG